MEKLDSEAEVKHYKVILIGDAGVGKTSLARWQAEKTFDFKMKPTVGSSHVKIKVSVDGQLVELRLWDTAGQEQFASLVPMYSRNTDVCIVVSSVVNNASCEHIKTWINRVHDSNVFPAIVVAFNKIDLLDEDLLSVSEFREKYVPEIKDVFLTSARTGVGIDELFQYVAISAKNMVKKKEIPSVQPAVITDENENNEQGGSCC